MGVTFTSDRDAAAVRYGKLDLLGAQRCGIPQGLRQRELVQRDLTAVGKPAGSLPEKLLFRAPRRTQAADDTSGLPVQGHQLAARRIEHHDAHRRGVDQRLEVGAGASLLPMHAGVGDRGGRL